MDPLKLTDLNDLCQIMAFEKLDVLNLVNVFEANASLIPCAVSAFITQHRSKTVVMCNGAGLDLNIKPTEMMVSEDVLVSFVEHFGQATRTLTIDATFVDFQNPIDQII